MKKLPLVLAVILFSFSFLTLSSAQAALRANCIDRLLSKSEGYLKNVEGALNKSYRRSENKFNRIDMSWGEFARYYRGSWATQCTKVTPENRDRFNKFLKERATPVSQKVRDALFESCTAYSKEKIGHRMDAIKKAIAEGKEKIVKKQLKNLQVDVKKHKIIARCKPVRAEIDQLLGGKGEELQAQAAAKSTLKNLESSYASVAKGWYKAQEAFKNKKSAPGYLAGGQGQSDYSNSVDKCVEAGEAVEGAKVDPKTVLSGQGGGVTVGQAISLCKKVSAERGAFFDKVVQHNANLDRAWRDNWKKKNVKGGAMKKVFAANNERIPRVEDLGSKVIWTYRSYTTGAIFHECKDYTFNGSGSKLISNNVRRCE